MMLTSSYCDAGELRKNDNHVASIALVALPGILIVDHIHFQYNGFLFGILVLSISTLFKKKKPILSAGLFASLICFKHIFLYLLPAFAVYLGRTVCLTQSYHIDFRRITLMGLSVSTVFALAFGPFIFYGQLPQLFQSLFPFSRGLCHAYWAPNAWALYSFADRVLIQGFYIVI